MPFDEQVIAEVAHNPVGQASFKRGMRQIFSFGNQTRVVLIHPPLMLKSGAGGHILFAANMPLGQVHSLFIQFALNVPLQSLSVTQLGVRVAIAVPTGTQTLLVKS